jgi:hypothetical protein
VTARYGGVGCFGWLTTSVIIQNGLEALLRRFSDEVLTVRLLQLEDSAAYNLTIDLDVHAIGTHSECARG